MSLTFLFTTPVLCLLAALSIAAAGLFQLRGPERRFFVWETSLRIVALAVTGMLLDIAVLQHESIFAAFGVQVPGWSRILLDLVAWVRMMVARHPNIACTLVVSGLAIDLALVDYLRRTKSLNTVKMVSSAATGLNVFVLLLYAGAIGIPLFELLNNLS